MAPHINCRTLLTGTKLRLELAIERSDTPDMTHDLAADREIGRLAASLDRLLVMARTLKDGGSAEIELHGGPGLGLAIARDLAERWGGALSVQNPEGDSTRIEVRFRVAQNPNTDGAIDSLEAR